MKNIKYMILALCTISVWACKPEKFGPIGSEDNVLKAMQGTWSLTKVTQVDQDASTKGFPYKQLDITNIYAYKDLSLTLQGDASGAPSTFTISPGNSPKIADFNSGTWTVDNAKAPTFITIKNGNLSTDLTLGSYAGLKSGKFYLRKVKKANSKIVVSYLYEFTKK